MSDKLRKGIITDMSIFNIDTGELIMKFDSLNIVVEMDFNKSGPKTCGDGCHVVCDFCTHYVDDSKLLRDEEFQGEGICWFHKKEVDCSSGCDNFYCFNAKEIDQP